MYEISTHIKISMGQYDNYRTENKTSTSKEFFKSKSYILL